VSIAARVVRLRDEAKRMRTTDSLMQANKTKRTLSRRPTQLRGDLEPRSAIGECALRVAMVLLRGSQARSQLHRLSKST
jgi:hypothetical protein